ncbi:uncharacterized protein MYCFIDRAFT_203369 [Pseudocercospora fijiensis CIRAD86]|uniref:N-terminal of MaoC-like dehydratase domain-containing protein n=1 Tax=Pseudocercospora fijiensis (strain CIRAD86) TaxID=383855 RepID=M2ZUM1_PSEFD|nr:uncharacterized protein MYCFIDRAFT_203369 [Pseudocercospora fijiensis CIRAD86]EME82704.1 hypothetical protein MYCFIDRAFT_203369 [Pseudocercospora fijiensis CIRAD86]
MCTPDNEKFRADQACQSQGVCRFDALTFKCPSVRLADLLNIVLIAHHMQALQRYVPHKQKPSCGESSAGAALSMTLEGKSFARKQLLDANQARLFSLTLNRPKLWPTKSPSSESLIDREPKAGTPLPAGYHNAYFTPTQMPGQLGIDGTDTTYNPQPPFTRRMWAGGSLSWPGADPNISPSTSPSYLKIGDTATEITKVLSCEAKTIKKSGEAMLVVGVLKEFYDSREQLCVVDRRNWVFREALDPNNNNKKNKAIPPPPPPPVEESKEGKLIKSFHRTSAELFRISALTFNAHRIHYDRPWAVEVEGHRDLVVHGPLNMICCLDFWRDEYGKTQNSVGKEEEEEGEVLFLFPKRLEYRATSPVYVEERYKISMDRQAIADEVVPVEVVGGDGRVCMKGEIERW